MLTVTLSADLCRPTSVGLTLTAHERHEGYG